jgi:hypothetical protein
VLHQFRGGRGVAAADVMQALSNVLSDQPCGVFVPFIFFAVFALLCTPCIFRFFPFSSVCFVVGLGWSCVALMSVALSIGVF